MVSFAHSDDAEVQCAGTIALWVEAGKKVTYVVLTKGDKGTQDPAMAGDALAQFRQEEQLKAASELGVEKVLFLQNNDGELEVNLERRKILTRIIREHSSGSDAFRSERRPRSRRYGRRPANTGH